jgi:hypothetical protein
MLLAWSGMDLRQAWWIMYQQVLLSLNFSGLLASEIVPGTSNSLDLPIIAVKWPAD